MHRSFLYGVHSRENILTAQDVEMMYRLGHTAHLRIITAPLKRHEFHRESQILHYLKHYGITTIVDSSNSKDVHKIFQHLCERTDHFVGVGNRSNITIVVEHDGLYEEDVCRAARIRASLRTIEASQEQGAYIRGYFAGAFVPKIRPSDIVFQAIIQQALSKNVV